MNKLFDFDKKNNLQKYLIGTDEAGRGPAAGDVYAAAVCFINPDEKLFLKLNDSKQLNQKTREELFNSIITNSIYAIEKSTVEEIEKNNILNASLNAMNKACLSVMQQLNTSENIQIFVDGNKLIKNKALNQKFIIKGDSKSAAIAAASILAKVSRDRKMLELDKVFPQYFWRNNKGYLTKDHIEAIKKYGITKYHRKKFVRNILEEKSEQLSLI